MFSIISICELPFWMVLLSWLLPFLFGLLGGWLLWAPFKRRYKTAVNERDDYLHKSITLEAGLEDCQKKNKENIDFIGDLKAQVRELERKEMEILPGKGKIDFTAYPDKSGVLRPDNLQIIEGIGPKLQEFLNQQGILNWGDIASKQADEIRDILSRAGGRFRIIDPSTWPFQASKAQNGDWFELIQFQKQIGGNQPGSGHTSDSKLENIMIQMGLIKQWRKDDLKAIEGIGPKIEGLLHAAGLHTWLVLAETPVEKIKSILDEAGSHYQLADPGTWPKQAELAALGKWAELEQLQRHLKGGREPG